MDENRDPNEEQTKQAQVRERQRRKTADQTYQDQHHQACPGSYAEAAATGTKDQGFPTVTNCEEKPGKLSHDVSATSSEHHQPHDGGSIKDAQASRDPERETCQSKHPEHMQQVVFHIYLDYDADGVSVLFEKPLTPRADVTLTLHHVGGDNKYWTSTTIAVSLEDYEAIRYRYVVKYHQGFAGKVFSGVKRVFGQGSDSIIRETCSRKLFHWINQYDIFKPGTSSPAIGRIFEGQLFFVKRLYGEINCSGVNLKDLMIECEHVGFGHPSYRQTDKHTFSTWMEDAISDGITPYQSAFLCAILGQFLNKAGYYMSIKAMFIWSEKVVDGLLGTLRFCPKKYFPGSSLDSIKLIDWKLQCASSSPHRLGYILNFCHLYDSKKLLNFAQSSHMVNMEKLFDDFGKHIVLQSLPMVGSQEDRFNVSVFLVKASPSINSLWKLYRNFDFLSTDLIALLNDTFVDRFNDFFLRLRKPNVLDTEVWKEVPLALKPKLALPFCDSLMKHVKQEAQLTEENLGNVKYFMLDKDLQRSAARGIVNLLKWLAASKPEASLKAACEVLEAHNFHSFWKYMKDEDKDVVARDLLRSKIGGNCRLKSASSKDKVVTAFRLLQDVCQIPVFKTDEKLVAILVKTVCHDTKNVGLKAIVDAYEEINTSLERSAKEWYMTLLQSTMEVDSARGHSLSRLIDIIRSMGNNQTTRTQKCPIDSGREEILLILLHKTKLPKPQCLNEDGAKKVLEAVLLEKDIWTLALEATGSVSRLCKNAKHVLVRKTLSWLARATIERNLRVGFFKGFDVKEVAVFLALSGCDPASTESSDFTLENRWQHCLTSFTRERSELYEVFDRLKNAITLVQNCTDAEGTIKLEDSDVILEQWNSLRRNLNDTVLAEILSEKYWGPLKSLLGPAKDLSSYSASTLFSNVAVKCVKALQQKKQELEGQIEDESEWIDDGMNQETEQDQDITGKAVATATVAEVLQFLSDQGIPDFSNTCGLFFKTDGEIAVDEINILLYGLKKEELEKELKLVSTLLGHGGFPLNVKRMLKNHLKYPEVQTKIQNLIRALEKIGYNATSDSPVLECLISFVKCTETSTTLKNVSEALNQPIIVDVDKKLDPDLTDILSELGEATELIDFITKTANDDMVDLVDAVEEHSDQLIQESTVSYLIDVHRFLSGLLKDKPDDPINFFADLVKTYEALDQSKKTADSRKTKMAAKIKLCSSNVHSLRGLYMTLANRGEMTKEIIGNAVKNGCYQVEIIPDKSCQVLLTYDRKEGGGTKASYGMSDLHDLRSRALLIVNSEKIKDSGSLEKERAIVTSDELSTFIHQVDLITEIIRKYDVLRSSGLPEYQKCWKKLQTTEEIKDLERSLNKELDLWNTILHNVRMKYFYLNYFHANQLWTLKKFFREGNKLEEEDRHVAFGMFRSIDPRIQLGDLPYFLSEYRPPKNNDKESELHAIGQALEEIFKSKTHAKHPLISTKQIDATVEPGKLFVAVLESKSAQTVHVIMSLFQNTSASLPEPSQVLFCHSGTTWEEIELLLRRTFEAHVHGNTSKLHCLANVESLPNDIQFELVDTIKKFQSSIEASYRLALVCRGGDHHHIVDQFSDFAHHSGGMADAELRDRFAEARPNVLLITADLPGLGKTETIHDHAVAKRKRVVTFPISGPLSRRTLVRRLSTLKIKKFQAIHFEIGEVDDPLALDTFLFELIVIGMVLSGTELFHLPTEHIYVEVANTLQHWIRDTLPVTKCFKRIGKKWENYKDLVISQEVTSPIQVVCHYLQAYDRGTLESEEVIFSSSNKVKPLNVERCRSLLLKHFATGSDPSFNILENFLSVLADQLLKFSRSQYFKPHNLEAMVGKSHDVRVRLFKALLEVATSFAARSVNTCKAKQAEALNEEQAREAVKKMQSMQAAATAHQMVSRVNEMIQWADNESIVIVFHGLGSITPIYRDLDKVPQGVKDLFKSQAIKGKGQGLDDYQIMSQTELQIRLERICDATAKPSEGTLSKMGYALTPDNILKMALISQRMQANIPVIVMGETGCGKTTLVRYLAATRNTPFHVFNFHAGITEEQIIEFILLEDKEARGIQKEGKAVWVFLDEINTCDYLGTVNEIVCHRSVHGTPLASNLVFVAACNPYRLRPPGKVMTAGLSGKTSTDEYSKLVYRVHPLPETMIDYVWDYGSLSPEDERGYISRMVEGVWDKKYEKLLATLLAASQDFVRETEGSSYCVSLRDVHRSIILMKWFQKMLKERPFIPYGKIPSHLRRYFKTASSFSLDERSVVLSLAHCYLSRLPTTKVRDEYCKTMTSIFKAHNLFNFVNQKAFQEIIRAEQEDYLLRMELPEGTACNAALRENVFVILVCILNRIPVFVVGKPGCSKSLSMQVIRSNLRGQDSKDPFLKTLPQLFVVSYQGSESSTSEGIEKVFEKARKYKEKTHNVLPVVLLDEIGLAEVSKFNPLKVLHRLLEPGKGEFPDVAVVGISNWALDAAKMNRAIHLSRPEPDQNDLHETGLSIRQAQINKVEGAKRTRSGKEYGNAAFADQQLKSLAEAYYQYQSSQKRENFHGLRDYYSMVKCLDVSTKDKGKSGEIQRALQRNFGGLTRGASTIQQLFLEKLEKYQAAEESREFPVTDLIRDNLHDKLARHLMLITNSDSAIGILDQTLKGLNKEKITIFGSRFEEDLSADYDHRVLSRIILCMEQDCVLILRDLENIYGSLYDMLNQNYIVVGGKKNCRIALGAYSNPMCQVHDGFRCIVLVDQSKVDYTDPPFLNRFEKQLLRFSDVLNVEQQEIIKELCDWTESISTLEEHGAEFDETDMFAGFHDDTLPSLVLNHSQDSDLSREDVLKRCKEDLMAIASPDAVLRSLKSNLHHSNDEEVKHLHDEYFQRPVHEGLEHFLHHSFKSSNALGDESCGMKILVMTHSNIHTNVSKDLASLFEVQIEKLSSFKSEKQLSKRMQHFWVESHASLLVVQCQPDHDTSHILLAKSIIEQQRNEFLKSSQSSSGGGPKHVCIVIHLQRERTNHDEKYSSRWQFNFLSGWKQVMIDVLERPVVPITDLLEVGVLDVLHSDTFPFEKVAANQLLWCFTRIKYPSSRQASLENIMTLVNCLSESQTIMECFKQLCCQWIQRKEETSNSSTQGIFESWQVSVACDRQALVNCSTLVRALEHFVYRLVRQPLAKIIYFMENESVWSTCQDGGEDELRTLTELMLNVQVFNIDQIPDPQGAESLVAKGTSVVLKYPFSSLFCQRIESVSIFFMEEFRRQQLNENNLDKNGELTTFARESLMKRVSSVVEQSVPEIIESGFLNSNIDHYVEDVLDMKSEEFSDALNRSQRVSLLKASLLEIMPTSDAKNDVKDVALIVTRLHSAFWIAGNSVLRILQFVSTCHTIAPVELCEIVTTFYCKAEKEQSKNGDKQDARTEVVNESNVVVTSCKMHSDEELQGNYDNLENRLPDKAESVKAEELQVHVLETAGGMNENADIVVEETGKEKDERLFEPVASKGSTKDFRAIYPEGEETTEDVDFNQTAMKHTLTLPRGKEMKKTIPEENNENFCCREVANTWAIQELKDLPHLTETGEVDTMLKEKAACEVTENGPKDGLADKSWSENEETWDPACEIEDKHGEGEDETLTIAILTKVSTFTADTDTGPESKGIEEKQESVKESMEDDFNIVRTENELEDKNDKLEQSASQMENSPKEEEMKEMSGSGDHEEVLAMSTKESTFTEDNDTGPESKGIDGKQESLKESMEDDFDELNQMENGLEDNNDKLEQSASQVENSPEEEEMKEMSGSGDHEEEELTLAMSTKESTFTEDNDTGPESKGIEEKREYFNESMKDDFDIVRTENELEDNNYKLDQSASQMENSPVEEEMEEMSGSGDHEEEELTLAMSTKESTFTEDNDTGPESKGIEEKREYFNESMKDDFNIVRTENELEDNNDKLDQSASQMENSPVEEEMEEMSGSGDHEEEELTLAMSTKESTFTEDNDTGPESKGIDGKQESLKQSMEGDFDELNQMENGLEDNNDKLEQSASQVGNSPEEEEMEEMSGSGDHEREELNDDQRQTDGLQETFDGYIVREFCSAMIPTEDLVSTMGGPDKWQSATGLILSMASRMPSKDPVFYYLRVCYDFTSLVLLPESLKPCFLYLFGELGKKVAEEDYLDSTRCFETFCETIEDLRGEVKDENRLTEFLYLFFARCIDSNSDTPSLGGILKQISSSDDVRLLRLACPIVFRVLLSEEPAFTPENFGKILGSPSELDHFPNLIEIKEVLSPFEEGNVMELDPHFLVMCCDLINEVAFKDLSVKDLSGSDSPELKNFHRAMGILTDKTEDIDCGLFDVVCAIAYVRAFMIAFASFLQNHPRSLSTDGEYAMLINDISGALNPGGRRETQVCCFLLKELRNKLSMFEIQSMCEQSEKLQVLKELEWQERHSTAKLSLDPFLKLQQKSEAEHALGKLLSNENPQPMQKVLCSLDSSQTRVELAAVLMKVFYLTRSIRNIKDTEDAVAVVLKDNIKNVSKPYLEFILRIVNQNKFGSPKLDISPESSPMDVQIAALMLHLTTILTSSYSDKNPSAFMCCLTDPAKLSTSHIFAAPENAKSGFAIYTNFDVVNHPRVSRLRCSCGTTLAVLMEEVLDLVCPNCKRALDVYCLQHEDPAEPPKAACAVGYLPCDPQEMLDDLICVRKLRPAEFRILHLAVHCALFMGHAMQLTDDKTLAKFLSQEKKIDDPSELCFQHVRHDLNVISRLFDCREELALNLLHSVFESTTSLLTEDLKMALPHDQTARCSWEENFATVLSPLIMKFQHNEITPSLKGQNNVQCLEDQIDEVGEPHYLDVDASNLHIPRLFRKTKPKSFTGLRSYYLNSPADVKEKHQLLGLFLDYHNKLPLAGNLVALNTWSRLVDFLLSRRLTRGEAKEKKIADAIIRREEQSMQTFPGNVNKENLGKMFEDFRKAWETILPHVQEQLEDGDTMPYIGEMNSVGYCLVETRELGRYLASALTFLARIQNEFLDKVLAIAATGNSSAVDFLHKGDSISVLPVVHVQDAREKEIVQYEWTDLFLVHSQHNTEYGHGTEIIYDLGKIEKEMAVKFIIGKSYLAVSEGLKEFVFSKQLFHDCADILNELQLAVPQEPLPNDVERGILSLAEKSLGSIQTLLESMEIVLCFLKRTGGKKDDSLVDFIDSWVSASQHFSKELLPEPQDAIKLKHVAALYESLEDKLSASAAECVSDEYREPLSDDSKGLIDESDALKSKQGNQIILEATVVALTRFIFRYLCLKPEPGNDLLECMKDPSLWPIGLVGGTKSSKFQVSVIVPQLIPKMLTIGHVHSVLAHFQDHLKRCFERRGTMRGARAAAAVRPRAQRSQAKKGRRSFGTGLS